MNPVDKVKITDLFQELRKAVNILHQLRRTPEEAFLASFEKIGSARYFFIVAIESAIDICNHIIAAQRLGQPKEYAEVFRVMGEAGIFPPDFVQELEEMARFRNLLVHVYARVDDRRVYELLETRLSDFERFESGIREYLAKIGDE